VHLHLGSPHATLAALRYIKKRRKPFVVTHHLDPEWNYGSVIRRVFVFIYAKYYVKKALSKSDIIIALSKHFLNMSKFLSDYRTKIETIPNGINLEDFNTLYTKIEAREKLGLYLDDKIILFVGALTERKGPQVLLKAMPIILRDLPDSRLILVGSSTNYLKSLEKLAHDLGIESNIEFTGFVDDATKVMYYKSADVFVLPSFSEAFPIVILEASVCGLPLVVSNLEAFKTIVRDGHNGVFTKTGDEKDLAEKIVHLLKNEDVRNVMGENAREKVGDYSWDGVAEETENVYRRLV
jgi:glycosyltransferase involved in cell wall biosynthesis